MEKGGEDAEEDDDVDGSQAGRGKEASIAGKAEPRCEEDDDDSSPAPERGHSHMRVHRLKSHATSIVSIAIAHAVGFQAAAAAPGSESGGLLWATDTIALQTLCSQKHYQIESAISQHNGSIAHLTIPIVSALIRLVQYPSSTNKYSQIFRLENYSSYTKAYVSSVFHKRLAKCELPVDCLLRYVEVRDIEESYSSDGFNQGLS